MQRERDSELMQELNLTEDKLTDMKILQMLQEFIYNYRFEQKIKKLKGQKNAANFQMRKVKTLKANEQEVFVKFLDELQFKHFALLSKKFQIKSELKDRGIDYEEQKEPLYNQQNGGQQYNSAQQYQKNKIAPVNIDNKSEFPDLVDQRVIQQKIKQNQAKHRMVQHHHKDMQHRTPFTAGTQQQEEQLYRIQEKFRQLQHDIIQNTYDLLNDAILADRLFEIAFPNLQVHQSHKQDNPFENFFKASRQKEEQIRRKQGQILNQKNSNQFFTKEIISKYRNINKQKSKANFSQQIYKNSRDETKVLYEKRKFFLDQVKKAQKSGNYQQSQYAQQEAQKYKELYEKQLQKAQMEIFQVKNSGETMDWYIDLHGMHLTEALQILERRLRQIKVDLDNGILQPNIDRINHVLKIVCGRGNHSKGRAVLKFKVPQYLVSRNFEIHNFEHDGVVLVRFQKK